jgi:hypothetical protein
MNGSVDSITIPTGDLGEQLVANLILSLIVCQPYAYATAYIARAHELAVRLEGQTITYRPKPPSKFARMKFELQGTTEIVLLFFIDNVLVRPPVGPPELSRFATTPAMAGQFGRCAFCTSFANSKTVGRPPAFDDYRIFQRATEATSRIREKCFYREIIVEEPLDRADDCLSLSYALIAKCNFQTAAVSLKNADRELDTYMRSTRLREYPPRVQRMKEQIAAIIRELGSGAA